MKHKDFGAVLKAARLAKGLSTRAVNVLTGISYSSISLYENKHVDPSFLYMVLLCDVYDVELNDMANTVRPASHHRDRHTKSISDRHIKRDTTLGEVFKTGRERSRLSTRAVEALTGVSCVSVTRYETNESMPSFTPAVRMCDLYGIYIDDLANLLRHHSIT